MQEAVPKGRFWPIADERKIVPVLIYLSKLRSSQFSFARPRLKINLLAQPPGTSRRLQEIPGKGLTEFFAKNRNFERFISAIRRTSRFHHNPDQIFHSDMYRLPANLPKDFIA